MLNEASIISDLLSAAGVTALGLLTWAVRSTAARIKRLENCSVRREDFRQLEHELRSIDRSTVTREELKHVEGMRLESRRELIGRMESLDKKIDELKTLMLNCVNGRNHGG